MTQGAWTGVDFEGCDDFKFDEYSPCYIEANGSRPTRPAHSQDPRERSATCRWQSCHGTDDELVSLLRASLRQAERFSELGYRHRFYTSPGYEHYSHPIMDQWVEAGRLPAPFTRPETPSRVTYIRATCRSSKRPKKCRAAAWL